ncbi:flagellar hook basal-body protein [Microbulbifer salipaludis]|uniref:Flagellar hook basal-body protein n=1 Tax=Microbulbifer salipaludis TaxID=187980 RepID=A0ABS3EA69_9GAMM|nr:flagellar hook basal-body protein [Microbulbifer salipaludis]
MDALYIAQTGLNAQAEQLDVISNNISNMNTRGYKKAGVEFTAVLQAAGESGQALSGVAVEGVRNDLSQGAMQVTNNQWDIAIQGNGFFQVALENGDYAYVRSTRLSVDEDGYLKTSSGEKLSDYVNVPYGVESVSISPTGEVIGKLDGAETVLLGEIQLHSVMDVSKMSQGQGGLFYVEDGIEVTAATPGDSGMGLVRQGYVEGSNVELTQEMVQLIMAQRGYQLNAKIVQIGDQIMETVNNLRR